MNVLTTTTSHLARRATRRLAIQLRSVTTISNNPHIYVFRDDSSSTPSNSYILSFLPTEPPARSVAIGSTTELPPTPSSLRANPKFLTILQSVIAEHAHADPFVQSEAAVMISTSGGSLFQTGRREQEAGTGGTSGQGGYGSGGGSNRGGFVHVYDQRRVPDYGRIPDPEDIFGSVEVDGEGKFVDGNGRYEQSGTYRVCTNDGILGLTDFLRQRLVERLKLEEAAEKNGDK